MGPKSWTGTLEFPFIVFPSQTFPRKSFPYFEISGPRLSGDVQRKTSYHKEEQEKEEVVVFFSFPGLGEVSRSRLEGSCWRLGASIISHGPGRVSLG